MPEQPEGPRVPPQHNVGIELAARMIEQMVLLNNNMGAFVERMDAFMELVETKLGPTIAEAGASSDEVAAEMQIFGRAFEILSEERNSDAKRVSFGDFLSAYVQAKDEFDEEADATTGGSQDDDGDSPVG